MTASSRELAALRSELYDIVRSDEPFETKATAALEVGATFLGADSGYLARVDPELAFWEVLASTEPVDGAYAAGRQRPFEKSYCRRTIESVDPVALPNIAESEWADDPAAESHDVGWYHGTRLIVDSEPYGTVCFVGNEPRESFSNCEMLFAELLSRLLERELEAQQHKTELTRQANLAAVLNRVLRHNLRNKLSVVRGHTQLMANELEDTETRTALRHIDELIELCEKARSLDQTVSEDAEISPTDLERFLDRITEAVAETYPEATISVRCPTSVTVGLAPSFARAITELLENAAKHAGTEPQITMRVETAGDHIDIIIRDNGPGIDADEREVLSTGAETPLTHGSGLGLWLAYWIVTGHGGSIDAMADDDGTTMTVTLPWRPVDTVESQRSTLARARDQYQAAFEQASDAIVIVDREGRVIEANPAVEDVYGLESQQLLGRSIREFLPDSFDFETAWQRFQGRDTEQDLVTIVGADGLERRVRYSATTNIIPGHHLIISRVLEPSDQ